MMSLSRSAKPSATLQPGLGGFQLSASVRVVILLAAYVLVRMSLAHRIDAPTFGWRPSDLASIAVNYYRNGFDFANPQIMWGGAGAGRVEMEFPLQPFLTGLLFKVLGQHDSLCVLLPLAFGFGAVLTVEAFGRYLFGNLAGFVGGLGMALSPTLVYITTTGMWPDPPMVLFGTLGLYLLTRWSREGATKLLVLGTTSIALAVLFKLTAICLGLPVLGLFYERYGWKLHKQATTWIAAAMMLLPSAIWYAHSYGLYLADGNTFGILAAGHLKFPSGEMLVDPYLLKRAIVRVSLYHVTPVASAAALFGLAVAFKRKHVILLLWVATVVAQSVIAWRGVKYSGHVGYLLPILPIANLLSGLGVQVLVDWVRSKQQLFFERAWRRMAMVGALVSLIVVGALVNERRLTSRDLALESASWEQKKLTGIKVKQVTRPGSLIVVADDQMDAVDPQHSMTPPDVFFFGDRRGWYLSFAWITTDKIEELRASGAEYFVISLQAVDKFTSQHADLYAYLNDHYSAVTKEDGIVYSLRPARVTLSSLAR
jgi:hypothetical protein